MVVEIEDVLNDVVAERVLNERQGVVGDLGDELNTLRIGGVIDTPLQDATTVTVSSDLDAVSSNGVVNELIVLWNETVQALLNDVVAVEVLDQADDVETESKNNRTNLVGLTRVGQEIDHLLHGASAVHVE